MIPEAATGGIEFSTDLRSDKCWCRNCYTKDLMRRVQKYQSKGLLQKTLCGPCATALLCKVAVLFLEYFLSVNNLPVLCLKMNLKFRC